MKYQIVFILTVILISGCTQQSASSGLPGLRPPFPPGIPEPPPSLQPSLPELQHSLGACGDEANRLSKLIDDPAQSARQKAELCQQAVPGIEKCEESILELEDEFFVQQTPEAAEALTYLEEVKHKVYVADVLSKACMCAKTKEDFDSRIETDQTFSGKQILRVEKFCALEESCMPLIEGTLATPAAQEEALRPFSGIGLESPFLFLSEETAGDFTAYCTAMLADSDQKIASAQGENREQLEIVKALQQLYCTEKAIGEFDTRLFPDWMVLIASGPAQEASETLERYDEKYDIHFEGDEFSCPSVPFSFNIVKKTLPDGPESGCSRGVQDSCASAGGTLDPVTCECKNKPAAANCETYASSFSAIGTNPKNIDYAEGLQNDLSAEEACKSYAYQDISDSGFCNGKDQQLYAIYNSDNSCCAQYWVESLNQPVLGPGGLFCGYKPRTTASGVWQKVSGTEAGESLYHADWLGQYAFPAMGETCSDIESRISNLVMCS